MGDSSTGDAGKRRSARRAAREPVRAQLFFDLACPFTYLAAERVERAFSHVTWTATSSETLQRRCLGRRPRGRGARPRRRRAARRRAAAAAGVARALPARGAGRHARRGLRGRAGPRARRSCSPPAGSRSAAASTSTTRRSSPRRRPPPASRSRTASTPRATSGATARRGGRAASCSAAGADRLPVLRVGRSLFWGEQRVGAAAASVRQATRRSRAGGLSRAYGLTSPARICAFIASTVSGRSASSSTRRERRPRVVGLVEQQVEIRVRSVAPRDLGDLAFVHVQDARGAPARPHGVRRVGPPDRGVDSGR